MLHVCGKMMALQFNAKLLSPQVNMIIMSLTLQNDDYNSEVQYVKCQDIILKCNMIIVQSSV
jgi:hypothetical protein